MQKNVNNADQCPLQESSYQPDVTDVYISVFFDGTANNCYEELHKQQAYLKKKEELKEYRSATSQVINFAAVKNLFSDFSEIKKYGMTNYLAQKEQAERDLIIENKRGDLKVTNRNAEIAKNGGWKYSNIAILRSLARRKDKTKTDDNKVGLAYNLYIEGVGREWDGKFLPYIDTHPIEAGMGIGRTGVVGLVSKTMVFVKNYLDSVIPPKKEVNVHFAVFGFSRGSTCGRLFSFLITFGNPNLLPKKSEFKQYLPEALYEKYGIDFLQEYKKKTVDFLGIFDTVSSIGFLCKEDTSTNYGMNSFGKKWGGEENENVNRLHGTFRLALSDAANNYHCDNVWNYGLYSPKYCKHVFHICAIDEFRENFAIVDLGKNLNGHCTEVFMPGCHSDIGGGLMYNDGGENELITLRRKIQGKDTKLIVSPDPKDETPSEALSQDIMQKLGWFSKTTSDKHVFRSLKHGLEYHYVEQTFNDEKPSGITEGQVYYIKEDSETLDFKRFAKEGYSNIPLEMMMKRAMGDKGLEKSWPKEFLPFRENLPTRFKVNEKDDILEPIKKMADAIITCEEGKREWIVPKENEYIALRQNYLHFSCTDKIHKPADLGNPPNWVKNGNDYLLCRLVYHGDPGDNKSYTMADYKKS